MPIVELKIIEGRDQEVKERLIENVTQTVSETLAVSPERVRVLIYDIPSTHWAIGGTTVEKRRG
ncbi:MULTISPECIES: tautomerase family protein [Bacillus]|uniref:tautomerase family protein n=1 Tax=Bacillus TaxID=1386 RepID=UPI000BF4856A|nr:MULTISPECIES: 2-hydroxymuconate tautomerase family protein [unclassified Bacillus (in: firmicutes)]MCP1122320.1 2-hydroxymuconate tautomerase family protein [Bacillus sp. 3103sda1]PEZ06366.1 4-oxalocrotonate tautomerase [Bacillus sp. AFS018417]